MTKKFATKKKPFSGSSVGRTNRKLNKLARKGKLNRKTAGELRRIQHAKAGRKEKYQHDVQDDWQDRQVALAEADEEDVAGVGVNEDMVDEELRDVILPPSFLGNLSSSKPKKRRRGEGNDQHGKDDEEEDYERAVRQFRIGEEYEHDGQIKHLLPTKNLRGQIQTKAIPSTSSPEIDDEEQEERKETKGSGDGQNGSNVKESKFGRKLVDVDPNLSIAKLNALRKQLLAEHKLRISNLAHMIIESPDGKTSRLLELLSLGEGEDVEWLVKDRVAILSTTSLLAIFTDILPTYRLRERSEEEKQQKMKKETKAEIEGEESLLRNYKKYLQLLEHHSRCLKKKKGTENGGEREKLGMLSVKALIKLLLHNPGFNLTLNIITSLLETAMHCQTSQKEKVIRLCADGFRDLIHSDKSKRTTLQFVRSLNKALRDSPQKVPPALLYALLNLKIKNVEKRDPVSMAKEKAEKERKREHLKKVSKTEKKRQRQLDKLEAELRETEAEENKNTKLKINSEIMDAVFSGYFRVLRKNPETELLAPVLKGLSKFAHLINISFFPDLIASLQSLVAQQLLKPLESLHSIHTVFVILSGEGSTLNIDPSSMYKLFYNILPKIPLQENREFRSEQWIMALQCLDIMLVQRRKQVSLARVGAFVARLCLLLFIMPHPSLIVSAMSSIRWIMVAHPGLDCLVEDDGEGGGAPWLPYLQHPDHAHALSTNILFLNKLKIEDEMVVKLKGHILNNLPSQGRYRLQPTFTQQKPWSVFSQLHETGGETEEAKSYLPLSKKERSLESSELCGTLYTKIKNL